MAYAPPGVMGISKKVGNIDTISVATLGRLLRKRAEHVWAFRKCSDAILKAN